MRVTRRRFLTLAGGGAGALLCARSPRAAAWTQEPVARASDADWIIVNALHKHIEGADRLLMLWAGVALVAVFRDLLQCALIAMGKLQSLAGLVGVSALAAVLTMWFGITWWGAAAVLIGQIVGELINLAGIIHMLRKSMRQTTA